MAYFKIIMYPRKIGIFQINSKHFAQFFSFYVFFIFNW